MLPLEEQIECKKRELEALKKITALTDDMKTHLDELAGQVLEMNSNATSVSKVMENWNSISRSISLAGLSLLQYAEGDYEVGSWNNNNNNGDNNHSNQKKDEEGLEDSHGPLPETLVRIRMDDEN